MNFADLLSRIETLPPPVQGDVRPPPPEIVGFFVYVGRRIRRSKKSTLADMAGVSLTTVERVERGEVVEIATLEKIENAFGLERGHISSPRAPFSPDELRAYLEKQSKIEYIDDRRCENMMGDIYTHRHSFMDWEDDWVYGDVRLDLLHCPDEVLLRFLSEQIHPIVRTNEEEITKLLAIYNRYLAIDGFEIAHAKFVSNRPGYGGRQKIAGGEDVPIIARVAADALSSAQIDRMNSSLNSDPPLAIGTAKEFIETICKGILDARGTTRTGAEDLPRLFRLMRDALDLDDGDPNGSIRKVLNGLATAIQGIAELRGTHGTGHGPAPDAAMPEPVLAGFVVQSAVATGVFLVDAHRRKVPALEDAF